MKNIVIFISGRGSNFHAIAQNIESGNIPNAKIVAVVSNNPNAKGLQYAKQQGYDIISLSPTEYASNADFDKAILERLSLYEVDLICLAGYMKIISPVLTSKYQGKIINIHPALLPAFPGLHAQRQAIEYGAKVSGCTVHFVDEGVDTGPIIMQKAVDIMPDDDEELLSERILIEEHKLYIEAVRLFCEDKLKLKGRNVIIER